MRKHIAESVIILVLLMILSGCQSRTISNQVTSEPANNGLINGWLSTYDLYFNERGFLTFDWSSYQPDVGSALVCCEKQNSSGSYHQYIASGNIITESVEKENFYRYAIWYGDESLIPSVKKISIPETAWHFYYINDNNDISCVASTDYYSFFNSITNNPIVSKPTRNPVIRPTPKPTQIPTIEPSPTPAPDYSWHLQFLGINTDPDDIYTCQNTLHSGDTLFIHAKLSGGSPGEKILLYYELCMNEELVESSAFSKEFGDESFIWIRNTPYRYGTLSVRVFYYDCYGDYQEIDLGHTSIYIEPRDDNTQSETAKGWISGCDIYFNQYENLCFDMTNYESSSSTIIFFARNDHQQTVSQGTITDGMVVWDTLNPEWVYEYAIWMGPLEYARDVATLSASQIPKSAWIKISISVDHQITVLSSFIPINILTEN